MMSSRRQVGLSPAELVSYLTILFSHTGITWEARQAKATSQYGLLVSNLMEPEVAPYYLQSMRRHSSGARLPVNYIQSHPSSQDPLRRRIVMNLNVIEQEALVRFILKSMASFLNELMGPGETELNVWNVCDEKNTIQYNDCWAWEAKLCKPLLVKDPVFIEKARGMGVSDEGLQFLQNLNRDPVMSSKHISTYIISIHDALFVGEIFNLAMKRLLALERQSSPGQHGLFSTSSRDYQRVRFASDYQLSKGNT
jgi:hypothetical protein